MENSRILLLTGAIMSIILGAIVLSMGIIILSAMVDIGNINAQSTNFLVCNIGEILLGVVLIVMGILLCLNPDKRKNKDGPLDTYEKLSGSKTLGFCGAILGASLILIINFILNFFHLEK